jgi:hypothetical protein
VSILPRHNELGGYWTIIVHRSNVAPPKVFPSSADEELTTTSHILQAGPAKRKARRHTAPIYCPRNGVAYVDKTPDDFWRNALKMLNNIPPREDWAFEVDLYSNHLAKSQSEGPVKAFDHTVHITKENVDEVYKKDILSRLFDPNEDWDIAIRDSRLDKMYAACHN